jgi:hypothetical protein
MFNVDDGQVGSSAPPPAPMEPPVQAPPAVAQSPQPTIVNNHITIIIINSPQTAPAATPAPTAVVPPALPIGTPAEPSTAPRQRQSHAPQPQDRFVETLTNPPPSYRDITIGVPGVSAPLGTIVDYAEWLGELGASVIVNAIRTRNTLHPPLPVFPFGSP